MGAKATRKLIRREMEIRSILDDLICDQGDEANEACARCGDSPEWRDDPPMAGDLGACDPCAQVALAEIAAILAE